MLLATQAASSEIALKDYFYAFGALVALCAFLFGVRQYIRTQRWERTRFSSGLVKRLFEDDGVVMAMQMLDWLERDIVIPAKFGTTGQARTLKHDIASMAKALSMEIRQELHPGYLDIKKEERTPVNILYTDAFDRFFHYLVDLNWYIKLKLITLDDLLPIAYWAHRLDTLEHDGKKVFGPYLSSYYSQELVPLISQLSAEYRKGLPKKPLLERLRAKWAKKPKVQVAAAVPSTAASAG